jgi:hypothetical protein
MGRRGVVWDRGGEEGMRVIQRKRMGREEKKGRKEGGKRGLGPQTKFLDLPLIVSAQPAMPIYSVFELPRGWGLNPPVVCLTPPPPRNKMPWDTLGVSFNPPPLLMMLNRLCVMTMTMNRQMSTPHLFFDNSNPEYI